MASELLSEAAARLKRHYGPAAVPGPPGEWVTLVRVILQPAHRSKKSCDWSWIEETPLRRPEETAVLSGSQLAESLDAAGHSVRDAAVLSELAKWWLKTVGDRDAAAIFHERSLEAWQAELRAIRGVNWELADRILLFVGGLAVYPLDRGSMRIAARHGWVEIQAEYEDWQAFFAGGLRDRQADLAQLSQWNARVGRDFCGRQPECEECPLKPLLPSRGAISLESSD